MGIDNNIRIEVGQLVENLLVPQDAFGAVYAFTLQDLRERVEIAFQTAADAELPELVEIAEQLNFAEQLITNLTPSQGISEEAGLVDSIHHHLDALQGTSVDGNTLADLRTRVSDISARHLPQRQRVQLEDASTRLGSLEVEHRRRIVEDRQIRQAQDEADRIGLFEDQSNAIPPTGGFEANLALYKEVKQYGERPGPFAYEEAEVKLVALMEEILGQLDACIAAQLAQEKSMGALLSLRAALQNPQPSVEEIKQAYQQFKEEEKRQLLGALSGVLGRRLPPTNLREDIAKWPGTNAQKLAALLQLIPQGATALLSRRMIAEREALIAPSAPVQATNPLRGDLRSSAEPIQSLMAIKETLLTQPLEEALMKLALLESSCFNLEFKTLEKGSMNIAFRPNYHLYLIHKKEQPQLLKADLLYGNKAMVGAYNATNEERSRAFARTALEAALEGLEKAVVQGDEEEIARFLGILDSLKLDARDLPVQVTQLGKQILFGQFYHLHKAARAKRADLVDPDHNQFKNDFGNVAFKGVANGIDPTIKIQAIQKVREELERVWN